MEPDDLGPGFIPECLGLPSGVGYDRDPFGIDPEVGPIDDLDGAERLVRVLTLEPQQTLKERALLFSESDLAALLEHILTVSGDPANDVVASCNHIVTRDSCSVKITLTLNILTDPGSDRRLAEGIKAIFQRSPTEVDGVHAKMPCMKTAEGLALNAVEYAGGNAIQGAISCRVITHASHESVRNAFIARGVPAADILQISARAIGDTGVLSNTVIIKLVPGYPINRVPWKIPLQEPGECLAPRKVSLQGHKGCMICRDTSHSKSACKSMRENLCGRCTFPFDALAAKKRSPLIHDCEGGPTGYGAAHLDPMGDGWHQVWLQHEASRPAPAESEDPISSRSLDLQSACDLADIARAQLAQAKTKKKKKKPKRKNPPSPPQGEGQALQQAPRPRDLQGLPRI
jgi:hypothetical protein